MVFRLLPLWKLNMVICLEIFLKVKKCFFVLLGGEITTERNMIDHIFDKVAKTRSSTSLIAISSDAKYLHVIKPTTPHRFSMYEQYNSSSWVDYLIHVPEPPHGYPLTLPFSRGNKRSVLINESTDMSRLSSLSEKVSSSYIPKGFHTP